MRVEFFGDEVEEIRSFAVADQRSLDVSAVAVGAAVPRAAAHRRGAEPGRASWPIRHPELREMLDKMAEGHAVEGMESLAPALVDDMELLVDLLPTDATVLVCDPERVRARAHDLVATSQEFLQASWAAAAGGGQAPIDLGAAAYRTLGDVRTHALARGLSVVDRSSPFGLDAEARDSARAATPLRTETGEIVADRRRHVQRRRDPSRRRPSRRHLPR